jgi:hypothetical protein
MKALKSYNDAVKMEETEVSKNPNGSPLLLAATYKHFNGASEVMKLLAPRVITPLIMERIAYVESAAQDFLPPSA